MELIDIFLDFVSPAIVWGILFFITGFYGVVTLALGYHWREYNVHQVKGKKAARFYLMVSAVFFVIMLTGALMYAS